MILVRLCKHVSYSSVLLSMLEDKSTFDARSSAFEFTNRIYSTSKAK